MTITKSIESVAPLLIIGGALGALLFHGIPTENRELATAILSGLLGYLSKSRNDTPATTVTTGSPPDETTVQTGPGA